MEIPEFMKPDSYMPMIMGTELPFIKQDSHRTAQLESELRHIDLEEPCQVFYGGGEEPRGEIKMKKVSQIGSGTQADVFKVIIEGEDGYSVAKTRKIYNNRELAEKTLKQMYGEFMMARDLQHPNIVRYKYFICQFNAVEQTHEFHNVIELVEGVDMETYLRNGPPQSIEQVKSIGL